MTEKISLKGEYTFQGIDIRTGETVFVKKVNTICQGFFTGVFKFLDDDAGASDLALSYIAVGDGTAAVQRDDTALDNELHRQSILTKTYDNFDFVAKTQIGAADGNPSGGSILEAAAFAGGTAAADSGLLLSRVKVSIAKNSNIILNVQWKLRT